MKSMSKIAYKYLTNKVNVITTEDFKHSYDYAAESFDQWNDKMGVVSDKIVDLDYIKTCPKPWNFLDFGCGTGYITTKLMKVIGHDEYSITGIDLSPNMIEICKRRIKDNRVDFFNTDGIKFLETSPDKTYDGVFCTWALEYVPQEPFFTHIHRSLKDGGQLGLAVSKRGTIIEIEACVMEIIAEYPDMVKGVLDISCYLPDGMKELRAKVQKYGFKPVKMVEGAVELSFDSPEEMFDWLLGTGDIAGTMQMFTDTDFFRKTLQNKIQAKLYKNGKYTTYQTYVYGIFAK
jgi:ubiquinone/menaquinone biosynthesis C-methylase UbiE